MKGGRNRRSTEQHRQAGTYRRDRHGSAAKGAEPAASVPPPPRGLSRLERAVWGELARQVEERRSFSSTRITAFRLMVELVARLRASRGQPAYAVAQLARAATDALAAFGLTPSRPELPPVQDVPSELEEFMGLRIVPGGRRGTR